MCYGVGSGDVEIRLKGPAASERGHRVVCGMCEGGMGSHDERRGLVCA